jgi:anti-sigma B factor antagonist
MGDPSFPVEVVDGIAVVRAPEEIDITNAEGLRAALLEAAVRGRGTLVIDMSGTRFCDSAGIHTLVSAYRRAEAEDGRVLLVSTAAGVKRIFAITGLDRMIAPWPSLEEALAAATSRTGSCA